MDRVIVRQVSGSDAAQLAGLRITQQLTLIGRLPAGFPNRRVERGWRTHRTEGHQLSETAVSNSSMLPLLPGREQGSTVREAARLALLAGAPLVHVLLHDIDDPTRIADGLAPALEEMPLALLLFADLSERIRDARRWVDVVVRHLEGWTLRLRETHQLALFDMPRPKFDRWGRPQAGHGFADQIAELRWRLGDVDAAAFTWTGTAEDLRRHGWRSPSALAAGALTGGGEPTVRLLEGGVSLPSGRSMDVSRARDFGLLGGADGPDGWELDLPKAADGLINPVRILGESACFDGQAMLREGWEIPAQRTLRLVHYGLVQAAQHFVFRNAVHLEAIALEFALRGACERYARRGLITGADPGQLPEVSTYAETTPQPSLVADISARLVPWGTKVDLRFRVDRGGLVEA